jgi:hypothetical protein
MRLFHVDLFFDVTDLAEKKNLKATGPPLTYFFGGTNDALI